MESCSWLFKARIHKIHKQHMPLLSTRHLRVGYGYSLKITHVVLPMQIQNNGSSLSESLLTKHLLPFSSLFFTAQRLVNPFPNFTFIFFSLIGEGLTVPTERTALITGTFETKAGTGPCLSKHYYILEQQQDSKILKS